MKKTKTKNVEASKGKILTQSITDFGFVSLKLYADEVNLERAIPDIIDGLKPGLRLTIHGSAEIAKTQFAKAALIVGHVMGNYYPHGDSGIYGAMVTNVQSLIPLLHGKGNWGSITDGPAAYRYTNARLSNFARLGFDPHYANPEVSSYVPNYDERLTEPVSIPFPLPVILFSGAEGIGYGAACSIPSFTPESVAEVIKRLLKGEKMKVEDFAKAMEPDFKWGGQFVRTKENRKAWMEMFTSSRASVLFESPLQIDTAKHIVKINEWPNGVDPEKVCLWARGLPETQQAFPSKGGTEFTFVMKKGYNSVQFDAWVKKLAQKTRAKSSFNINVTRRTAVVNDGVVGYNVKLMSLSVPQLIMTWLKERLATEIRSLDYRIRKQQEAIAYSELLIMAAQKLDIIVPIIKKSKQPKEELAKKLKITLEQANQILDLTLRKLTRLDQEAIEQKRKEQLQELKQLEKWRKNPKPKMIEDTDRALEAIEADRKWYASKDKQELTLS
jgi:DNA gyrase subunit A